MALVFVGNSGAARECYWIWDQAKRHDPANVPDFKGFLGWKGYPPQLCELQPFYIGNSESYEFEGDDQFVIAIGNTDLRYEIYGWLKGKEAAFYTLKHPNVYICPSAQLGEANIFTGGCAILANVSIGNANYLNGSISVGHDSILGSANVFNLHTNFFGGVRVGNCNHFGPMTLVMEHSRIGSHNRFAPASVVYKGCGDYCLMSGNPALVDRHLDRRNDA